MEICVSDKLIIVESPTKIKSIKKIVGNDYDFSASVGHIRDLPKKKLGVDVENCFEPTYEIMPGKKKVIRTLSNDVKSHDIIYLACDPDREGEAIAWHIKESLNIPEDRYFRITTNEITQEGVQQALANPRKISMNMVNAQQARRIMDRLVGYRISPLLWKKIKSGLSAGRVQSIAVKLIVQREKEIEAFNPEEYWQIDAECTKNSSDFADTVFSAALKKKNDKKIHIADQSQADSITEELSKLPFIVDKVKKKKTTSSPYPPYRTSTLQRRAASYLKFSAKKTMVIAQQLYEGVDLGPQGSTALITYMRTDSTRISESALHQCRSFIEQEYGPEYVPDKPRYFKRQQRAQEAHEAIRPTDVNIIPENIEKYVSADQYQLYSLIWNQFVASQMNNAIFNSTTLIIRAGQYTLTAQGREMVFGGYTKLTGSVKKDIDKQHIPPLETGEKLNVLSINPSQHFTKPPKRYTQASLIRTLEKEGIGRPSTYAAIVSTIQSRNYVSLKKGSFYATLLGKTVTEKLDKYFIDIMDVSFTARMEEELDDIAEAKRNWVDVLKDFYERFSAQLIKARQNMKSTKGDEAQKTEYTCGQCGRIMVIRWGRNGPFLGCEGYFDPDVQCTFTMEINDDGTLKKDLSGPLEGVEYKGSPVCIKRGKYGYYLEAENGDTAPVPQHTDIEKLDAEQTANLFEASKRQNNVLGTLEDGSEVHLKTGKYGPYIQVIKDGTKKNISLQRKTDLASFSLDDARSIMSLPRILGNHPESEEPITLKYGKYGPYVNCGKENRSVKNIPLDDVTLEYALELLAQKPKRRRRKKKE